MRAFQQVKSAAELEARGQVPVRTPVILGGRSLWQKVVDLFRSAKQNG
jgi:hypothetical protein